MIPAGLLTQGVSKLGVLRPGAIGDVIVILPAIRSLRKAFPEAEIVLLRRSRSESLLGEGRSDINSFLEVPPIRGINDENGTEGTGNEDLLLQRIQDASFRHSPALTVLQKDIKQACSILPVLTQGPYVVINVLSSDQRCNWPLQHYKPVFRHLTAQGYRIQLTGSRQLWALIQPHQEYFTGTGGRRAGTSPPVHTTSKPLI